MNAERGTVLVTGGSGYIAGYCIAALLRQGYGVRATIRSLGREAEVRAAIAGLLAERADLAAGLSFAAADLSADAGWQAAAQGCCAVLHVASPIPAVNPDDDQLLIVPARDGALRVLRAARDAGIARVVMTASVATIAYGHGSREAPYTEAEWTDDTNRADTSAYERSKTNAERAVREWVAREGGGVELVTIHPGAVLGPVFSADFSPSVEIVKKLMDGSVPGMPRFGWPMVDVRDLADLHLAAMTAPGIAGERFIAANGYLWMRDVAAVLRQRLGAQAGKLPRFGIPDFVVRLVALGDPVIRSRLFELGKKRDASGEKARRVLGWSPRPVADTIVDTALSLRAFNIV